MRDIRMSGYAEGLGHSLGEVLDGRRHANVMAGSVDRSIELMRDIRMSGYDPCAARLTDSTYSRVVRRWMWRATGAPSRVSHLP